MIKLNYKNIDEKVFSNFDVRELLAGNQELLATYNSFCFQWLNGEMIFTKLAYLYSPNIEENGTPVVVSVIRNTIQNYLSACEKVQTHNHMIRPSQALLVMIQSLIRASRNIIGLQVIDVSMEEIWDVGLDIPFNIWSLNRKSIEILNTVGGSHSTKSFYETVIPENMKYSIRKFSNEKQILDVLSSAVV